MDTQEFEELVQFCAEQHFAFDAEKWLLNNFQNSHTTFVAAKYLSMTSWYGYAEQLENISARAQEIPENNSRIPPAGDFDIARFSGVTRLKIAQIRAKGLSN